MVLGEEGVDPDEAIGIALPPDRGAEDVGLAEGPDAHRVPLREARIAAFGTHVHANEGSGRRVGDPGGDELREAEPGGEGPRCPGAHGVAPRRPEMRVGIRRRRETARGEGQRASRRERRPRTGGQGKPVIAHRVRLCRGGGTCEGRLPEDNRENRDERDRYLHRHPPHALRDRERLAREAHQFAGRSGTFGGSGFPRGYIT